jgi:hypothetical protein
VNLNALLDEARRMPPGSVTFARGVGNVWTPEHLVPLRDHVRKDHREQLGALHAAIDERLGAPNKYVGVFYAASEMALMAEVGGDEFPPEDRRLLRQLWEDLLAASDTH